MPGRAVPSFLSGRYSAIKVRKELYFTLERSSVANASCGTVSITVSVPRIPLLVERNSRSDAAPVLGRPYVTIRDVIASDFSENKTYPQSRPAVRY